MKKKAPKRKRPPPEYHMRHLKQPWHKRYIKAYQDNVINQQHFLEAQRAQQNAVNRIRQISLTGNPGIYA